MQPPVTVSRNPADARRFGLFLMLASIGLCWLGAPVVVHCERISGGPPPRTDITVRRKLLGLIPIGGGTVQDVTEVTSIKESQGSSRVGSNPQATPMILRLTSRSGSIWDSPPGMHGGMPMSAMVPRLRDFILSPSPGKGLRMWCLSWGLHLTGFVMAALGIYMLVKPQKAPLFP